MKICLNYIVGIVVVLGKITQHGGVSALTAILSYQNNLIL